MKYFYLLVAGILVSCVHFFLVWHHRDNRKNTISEHVVLTRNSHILYFISHVICDVLFVLFSYQLFVVENDLMVVFYINLAFAILDITQGVLPSRGKTEKAHFLAAYISWCCYLLAGIIAVFALTVVEPYKSFALIMLIPILGMFFYMHINRSKLYPYQLTIVPLFVFYMFLVTLGAS